MYFLIYAMCDCISVLPSIVHLLDSITVNESDSVSLPCTASGVPEPTISWTPPSTGSIHQDESGALLIASAQANDGGIYTCEAISQVGMAVDTTQLIVQGNVYVGSNGTHTVTHKHTHACMHTHTLAYNENATFEVEY